MIDLFLLMKVGEKYLCWLNQCVFQKFLSDICKRSCNVQVKNEFTSSNINGFSHFILTNCDHPNYKYSLNSNVFLFQPLKHFQTYINVISFSSSSSFSKFNKITHRSIAFFTNFSKYILITLFLVVCLGRTL